MKKILLVLILFSAASFKVKSQSINGIPLADIDVEYVQIVGTTKLLSTKVTIELDFGQHNKVFSKKDSQLVDANGKKIVFYSMIDALNFMNNNGYNFVNAYAITVGNQNVYHYLLKKS